MNGEEFRAIRQAMGLTQVGLAGLLGLKPQTVSDLERGKMRISESMEKHILVEYKLWEIKKVLRPGDTRSKT